MTALSRVVMGELDRQGPLVQISSDSAAALERSGLVVTRPEPGGWRLLPSGKVGSVRLDGMQIDVHPKDKVKLTRLLFLLGYAAAPGWRPETVTADNEDDLWPALGESLVRLIRAALAPGVLQGYRTSDEALRTVRGRIRIGDQITAHPGQMVPIEVTFDEFTADIPENQILRTALRRMLSVPRLSPAIRAELGHLDGQLGGVRVLPPGSRLPEWRADRRNPRYVPALRLAEIVLANCSTETGDGSVQMAGFVVDMARVYEDFVGTALTEALTRYPGGTRIQYPSHLDDPGPGGKPAIPMRVDIVHTLVGRPLLVFDAKYKAADRNGQYPNADHYQMLAYCTALHVPTAWLVYAGGGHPARRRIGNTDITVIEYPLDLSAEPGDLLTQIDLLARTAWAETAYALPLGPMSRTAQCTR